MPQLHPQFSLNTDGASHFGHTLRRSRLEALFDLRGSYLQLLCLSLAACGDEADHVRLLMPRDGYARIRCVHAAVQHLHLRRYRGHVLETFVRLHLLAHLRLHAALSFTVLGIIRAGRLAGLMQTL